MVGGDFNSIKIIEERRGNENSNRRFEMKEFSYFIENMLLVDVQVLGNIFTWIKPNRKACSRLDRILLSEGMVINWGVVAQEVGLRDISDHKHAWLKSNRVD